jgi:hypothetical protein
MPSSIASAILKVSHAQQGAFCRYDLRRRIMPNRETNLATFAFQGKANLEKNGRRT